MSTEDEDRTQAQSPRPPKYQHQRRKAARAYMQAEMPDIPLPTNIPVSLLPGDAPPQMTGERAYFRKPPPDSPSRDRYVPATRTILVGEDWVPPSGRIELRGPGRPRKCST